MTNKNNKNNKNNNNFTSNNIVINSTVEYVSRTRKDLQRMMKKLQQFRL
jgi:hypothetical protein